MSTVEEIKAATAKLKPEEQLEVFKTLLESEAFRRVQWEALQRDINVGLEQADRGEVALLDINAINTEGRRRLANKPLESAHGNACFL